MHRERFRTPRLATAAVVAALLAGCATNAFVLGFAYDRVDDRLAARFKSFADFDRSQSAWIEARMTHWHDWHRRTQLPRYAEFLSALGARLGADPPPSLAEVRAFADRADALYQTLAGCHPLTETRPFLSALTDAQVRDIEARLAERLEDTKSEETEPRIEQTISGLSRLGFSFDAGARAEVAAHFARSPDIRALRRRALEAWSERLVLLLAERGTPEFEARIGPHMARALSLTRSAYPEQVAANVDSWVRMVHAILSGYDRERRLDVGKRLIALGDALQEISRSGTDRASQPVPVRLTCAGPTPGLPGPPNRG